MGPSRVGMLTNANVSFGLIPHDHWFQPDWIDEEKASAGRFKMMMQGIIYAGSVPYRNMCRFNSGVSTASNHHDIAKVDQRLQFFWKHELLAPYRYYWRVE